MPKDAPTIELEQPTTGAPGDGAAVAAETDAATDANTAPFRIDLFPIHELCPGGCGRHPDKCDCQ